MNDDEEALDHTQRVVIELRCGEGPMSGRFMADGVGEPQMFSGWLELLALLEIARALPDAAPGADK